MTVRVTGSARFARLCSRPCAGFGVDPVGLKLVWCRHGVEFPLEQACADVATGGDLAGPPGDVRWAGAAPYSAGAASITASLAARSRAAHPSWRRSISRKTAALRASALPIMSSRRSKLPITRFITTMTCTSALANSSGALALSCLNVVFASFVGHRRAAWIRRSKMQMPREVGDLFDEEPVDEIHRLHRFGDLLGKAIPFCRIFDREKRRRSPDRSNPRGHARLVPHSHRHRSTSLLP